MSSVDYLVKYIDYRDIGVLSAFAEEEQKIAG